VNDGISRLRAVLAPLVNRPGIARGCPPQHAWFISIALTMSPRTAICSRVALPNCPEGLDRKVVSLMAEAP
jgi:hypothetical protein